ncbi:hypothetical protein [Saccharopolyspora gregorii]|uniref:Uncharacterized protein n=1 Tax=Saccharopolyspora gregorii TaxID=33914 RepID=A0ABP6S0J4_9PSEU
MERVTLNLDDLNQADREAVSTRASREGRDIEEVLLDLVRAGLHGSVHNVNTGNVSGPSIQTGHIQGDLRF